MSDLTSDEQVDYVVSHAKEILARFGEDEERYAIELPHTHIYEFHEVAGHGFAFCQFCGRQPSYWRPSHLVSVKDELL